MRKTLFSTARALFPVFKAFLLGRSRMDRKITQSFRLPSKQPSQHEYDLTVVAIFKNEARYIEQWIEFHLLIGAKKFILYDNMSTDDTVDRLKSYKDSGLVDIIPWPHFIKDHGTQAMAYAHALAYFGHRTKWMAFIDIDEYLFAPDSETVLDFLSDNQHLPVITAFWLMFGTSGQESPTNVPLIETYTMRAVSPAAPSRDQVLANFKSIVQPAHVESVRGAHRFYLPDGSIGFNERGERMLRWKPKTVTTEKIRINHYYTKSKAEWDARFGAQIASQGRLSVAFLSDAFEAVEREPVRDVTIQRYLPALKAALARRS